MIRLADLTAELRNTAAVTDFVRLLATRTEHKSWTTQAAAFAERWPRALHRDLIEKAAIAPGTTTGVDWAAPLVVPALADAFVGVVRTASLLGRIPGLIPAPFNTRVPALTNGGTFYWVAQNAPKPVTKFAFANGITLTPTKCEGIIPVTDELAKLSKPGTESALQRELVNGITAFTDRNFLDPAVAAVAGVNPASITNGVTPTTPGATIDDTVAAVLAALFAARPGASGAVVIAAPGTIATLAGTGSNPDAKVNGSGSVNGVPLLPSEGALTNVIAIDPSGVVVADDGVAVDVSDEASVELDTAPTGSAASVFSSLWQLDMTGFRVERFVNWQAVSGAVQYAVVS
jgi:HK97 family phage major capsid protein